MSTATISLPGSDRKAVPGTAMIRWGEGRHRGLLIVSAVTDRGRREDLDSSACVFIAQAVADSINKPEGGAA